jgi:hypothetical protein
MAGGFIGTKRDDLIFFSWEKKNVHSGNEMSHIGLGEMATSKDCA